MKGDMVGTLVECRPSRANQAARWRTTNAGCAQRARDLPCTQVGDEDATDSRDGRKRPGRPRKQRWHAISNSKELCAHVGLTWELTGDRRRGPERSEGPPL